MMRPSRLAFLLAALLLLVGPASPAADPSTPGQVAGLEDRLKAGLRTRRPEETAFVEKVAAFVRSGRLPAKLVDSTYLWAVERRTEYPFPAFQQALRMQASKLGVRL